MSGREGPAPLSAKFAVLRCHVASIADVAARSHAMRLLEEIESRVRPVALRLERERDSELQYPRREWL